MRLFISYAHVDKAIVEDWIVSKLVARGHDVVWFDARLETDQEWKQTPSREIQRSDALVYAVTLESFTSEKCQREVKKAIDLGKPLIYVLIEPHILLYQQLEPLQYIDFTDGPTDDAVTRLTDELQQLSPLQIPSAPSNRQNAPPQGSEPKGRTSLNRLKELLNQQYVQAIIGILSIIVAILIAAIARSDGSSSEENATQSVATPATPVVVALRNLDIRSGPGSEFNRIGVLADEDSLDISGITDDSRWYQVLLADGTYGWVVAAESFGRFEGNRSVLRIVTPTATHTSTHTTTPTHSPSNTPTATSTQQPIATETASATTTNTPTSTVTFTSTATDTQTAEIPTRTVSVTPTNTPTVRETDDNSVIVTLTLSTVAGQYPCTARTLDLSANLINSVRVRDSANSPLAQPVRSDDEITILGISDDENWYQIRYESNTLTGWIPIDYVIAGGSCP